MPKVSVIIPVYNVEQYLKRCLDSVVGQTLEDIEIICVNDGSTDSSLSILKEYALGDNRIKIVDKENGGLASARNAGLKNAAAEFIAFLDSDDWFELTALEKAYNEMKDDIDIVCFYSNIVNEGLPEDHVGIISSEKYHKIKHTGLWNINNDVIINTTVTCWNKLFRKSILEKYKIDFPVGQEFEDTPFTLSYLTHCKKAFYIGEYLHNYVQRPNSIMERLRACKFDAAIDNLYDFDTLYNHLKEYKLLSEYKELLTNKYSSHLKNAYKYAPEGRIELTLKTATELAKKYDEKYFLTPAVKYVQKKQYDKVVELGANTYYPKYRTFLQKIFSVMNERHDDKTYKAICILGVKLKLRSKNA